MHGFGFRVKAWQFKAENLGFRSLGFRVWSSEFGRSSGASFLVWGLEVLQRGILQLCMIKAPCSKPHVCSFGMSDQKAAH